MPRIELYDDHQPVLGGGKTTFPDELIKVWAAGVPIIAMLTALCLLRANVLVATGLMPSLKVVHTTDQKLRGV